MFANIWHDSTSSRFTHFRLQVLTIRFGVFVSRSRAGPLRGAGNVDRSRTSSAARTRCCGMDGFSCSTLPRLQLPMAIHVRRRVRVFRGSGRSRFPGIRPKYALCGASAGFLLLGPRQCLRRERHAVPLRWWARATFFLRRAWREVGQTWKRHRPVPG